MNKYKYQSAFVMDLWRDWEVLPELKGYIYAMTMKEAKEKIEIKHKKEGFKMFSVKEEQEDWTLKKKLFTKEKRRSE